MAETKPGIELECPLCGGVAFRSDTEYVSEDEGEACLTCGEPGHVMIEDVDEDTTHAYWSADAESREEE